MLRPPTKAADGETVDSKYKGLLTASYQTPLGIWQFDATLQLNGGGRMPSPYELADGQLSWERRYGSFEQLSAQITRYFRRWSVYIGGENLTTSNRRIRSLTQQTRGEETSTQR